jgi:hypothetical protein
MQKMSGKKGDEGEMLDELPELLSSELLHNHSVVSDGCFEILSRYSEMCGRYSEICGEHSEICGRYSEKRGECSEMCKGYS